MASPGIGVQALLNSVRSTTWPAQIGGQTAAARAPNTSLLGNYTMPSVRSTRGPQGSGSAAFEPLIQAAAQREGVDPKLVHAVMKAESGFNPYAISKAGAKGLMQLMDGTARNLGVANSFDPVQNVFGGVRYLRQMLDRFGGNEHLALAAYNAGPAAVDQYRGIPPYPETQQYVRQVEQFRGAPLQSGGGGSSWMTGLAQLFGIGDQGAGFGGLGLGGLGLGRLDDTSPFAALLAGALGGMNAPLASTTPPTIFSRPLAVRRELSPTQSASRGSPASRGTAISSAAPVQPTGTPTQAATTAELQRQVAAAPLKTQPPVRNAALLGTASSAPGSRALGLRAYATSTHAAPAAAAIAQTALGKGASNNGGSDS